VGFVCYGFLSRRVLEYGQVLAKQESKTQRKDKKWMLKRRNKYVTAKVVITNLQQDSETQFCLATMC
jgi:hypothetical protein